VIGEQHTDPVRVGAIGRGNISNVYLANCRDLLANLDVVAIADLDADRARTQAGQYDITETLRPECVISDPRVEEILNLTPPTARFETVEPTIAQGTSVVTEKPIASLPAQGDELARLAAERGVLLGCASDTFLGAGLQTCRRLFDAGAIGEPVGAGT
jgi:predicted dehydrogenase